MLFKACGSHEVCMLRMQEPLVCTETDPGRPFKCTLSRDGIVPRGARSDTQTRRDRFYRGQSATCA